MTADPRLASATSALARAHYSSLHGSGQARSGVLGDRSAYVGALLARAQDTVRSWASWEAINDLLDPDGDAAEALMGLELGAIGGIRKAAARDAILGAFGLSDQVQNDRLTVCRLAEWLEDEAERTRLGSRSWAIDLGHHPDLADSAASRNQERIDHFRSLVVPDWKESKPACDQLVSSRMRLKATRDALAHALHPDFSEPPQVNEMRSFIALTHDLATDASLIWLGSAVGAHQFRDFAAEEAKRFWTHAFAEPIAVWTAGRGRKVTAR